MTLHRRAGLERRAGLTSSTGLTRRAWPTAVAPSPRRERKARLDVPPATVKLLRQRSAGRCEASVVDTCDGADATDVHHRQRRRDGGHAITNLLHLCRACHAWAHAHPLVSRRVGVIVSVYEDPAATPVLVRSRLAGGPSHVLLTADGGYLA